MARLRRELEAQEEELEERLEKARQKELALRKKENARVTKRRVRAWHCNFWIETAHGADTLVVLQKLEHLADDDDDEDQFLPEEDSDSITSEAVRAFQKWRNASVEEEQDPVCTKVRYHFVSTRQLISKRPRSSSRPGLILSYRN